jgi:transposase
MFIREVKKQRSENSGTFYQYNLVQAARVDGKVKQTVILYLGSDPLLKDKENRELVLSILKSKIFGQELLFPAIEDKPLIDLALSYYEKYLIKYDTDSLSDGRVSVPSQASKAEYHNVDIKALELSDVRSFGAEHLCVQMLEKLHLKQCFTSLNMSEDKADLALISIAAKALFAASEHKTAQILSLNSELKACYKYEPPISHKHLYASADLLYSHKELIDKFLYNRIKDLFNLDDKLVIFDISNTYFETRKGASKIARYGRSKEKRTDCPIVVFTGVINAQGFIRHSKIYEGNKPDTATLSDMIEDLSKYTSTGTKHTIVMDAGIATEDNLLLLQEKNYKYVCVSRKRLSNYIVSEEKVIVLTDRDSNKVELSIFKPSGYNDTWMYVQSQAKKAKESSMELKLEERFIEDLKEIQRALQSPRGTKKIEKVWERIGRAKEKHSRAAAGYDINVDQKEGIATAMVWIVKPSISREDKTNGVYFIRTNYENPDEKELWDIYNTIREVESTFRCLKSDLQIRPVHHQKDNRIESHIYLTILAYQLVNTIRHSLKKENINFSWSNILRLMGTQTIQTIEIITDKKRIHLRKPSKPIKEVERIYQVANCKILKPAVKTNVVYH